MAQRAATTRQEIPDTAENAAAAICEDAPTARRRTRRPAPRAATKIVSENGSAVGVADPAQDESGELALAASAATPVGETFGIASRQDRQRLWTAIMRDPDAKTPDRLKASELLGKSEGDFIDRVRHSGGAPMDRLFSESSEADEGEGGA